MVSALLLAYGLGHVGANGFGMIHTNFDGFIGSDGFTLVHADGFIAIVAHRQCLVMANSV